MQVRPQADDLDELAWARAVYRAALRQAVMNLRDQGASWSDIALACQARIADAKADANDAPPDVTSADPLRGAP
ncbi:hypothetical protein ACWEJ6_48655 [Nonomuraea sp. NPDC004702]